MTKLEQVIKKAFRDTTDHCEFKRAFVPRGWAAINIKKFSKDLAEIIDNSLKGKQ